MGIRRAVRDEPLLLDVLPLSLVLRPRLPSASAARARVARAPALPMRYCGAIMNAIEYWFTSGAERLKNTRPSIGEINVSRTLPSKVSRTSASA